MLRTTGLEPTLDLRPLIHLLGEKQFIQLLIKQMGVQRIVDEVGLQRIIDEMGLCWFLSGFTPEQLQELKQRLP